MKKQKKNSSPKPKLYVVRKFIRANSVEEALEKERKTIPDECYLHQGWEAQNANELESAIGFRVENEDDNN